MTGSERFLDRELSWLDFNARVLALAEDHNRPLLERAKFVAIFSSNLDEYFQVRVAALQAQADLGIGAPSAGGLDPSRTIGLLRTRVQDLVDRQSAVFTKDLAPALAEEGLHFVGWSDLGLDEQASLTARFEQEIFPILTPLAVDVAHPFPYISNLSFNLAVRVGDHDAEEERFARVKLPGTLPRFLDLDGGKRFLPIEQLVAAHLDRLFPGMKVKGYFPFRVTRDTDFALDDEADDLREAIEEVLQQRTQSNRTVRLEIDTTMPEEVRAVLRSELEIAAGAEIIVDGPLDLTGLFKISLPSRADLSDRPWSPRTPAVLINAEAKPSNFFEILRRGDVMVHHPYDSFRTSIEAFLRQAARDPKVLAVKQTIYRTGGDESNIIQALIEAARAGKQVVALVELQARFDEEANIERAQLLEAAGVHVVYGIVGLKTHAKIVLVVRQESDGEIRRYCHVGTGNYNPTTATIYEDIGLFTACPDVGSDVSELFNHLTGYSQSVNYNRLLVAPEALRIGLRDRVRAEATKGADGYIALKLNSLVDPDLIDELYDASRAGARVDLVVRGICCVRPQVPGLSENIFVRSIVGRYLEHSRIYRFGSDPATADYLIGSADWMQRNLDRRVEALCSIVDETSRARLEEILKIDLDENGLAWTLDSEGDWHRSPITGGFDTQLRFRELAEVRANRSS